MSERTHVPVVGIVGGIGSGKSTVARWVAARQDVLLVNGDEVGHEVLTLPPVRNAVRRRFGDHVLDEHGNVNRTVLGRIVFGPTAEHKTARDDLERIVHPQIRETFRKRIAEAAAAGKTAVLLDAAVLFEAGWNDLCDGVVFIDVPRDDRLRRLRTNRGWDDAELKRREASQLPLETKRTRAQFVVDNSRSIDEAGGQLEAILALIAIVARSNC